MSTISATGLGHRYGRGEWAVSDVDFALPEGSVTALVGANAAGKTTLLEILAGVRVPSVGEFTTGPRVRLVAHDKPLYLRMTGNDHLQWARRANARWNDGLARGWLRDFDVPLDRRCGALSTGQRAQVALAIALGAEPTTLLLDEVLGNFDPLVRADAVSGLLSLNAELGTTIVLSTHTPAELSGAVDHVLLMAAGRLVLCGQVDDLLERHRRYAGPRTDHSPLSGEIVWSDQHPRQVSLLLRHDEPPAPTPPGWSSRAVTLEELVHDYLRAAHVTGRGRSPMQLIEAS
jgi:ABC-2 type transport system ATP-binding protein